MIKLINAEFRYLDQYKEAYLESLKQIKQKKIKEHDLMFLNPDEIDVIQLYEEARENDTNEIKNVSLITWKETYEKILPDECINQRIENIDEEIKQTKEYQGKGIGKKLLEIAAKELQNKGYLKMKLECFCGNNNIEFYKKYNGIVKEKVDYIFDNNIKVKSNIVLFENSNELLHLLNK